VSISDSNPDKTVILLLAAGLSRRMGRLKQLLPLGNTTILGVTLDNILAARVGGVIVVVGAGSSQPRLIAEQAGIKVGENPFYRQGMSTSLSAGLQAADPACNMVMVALADQPLSARKHTAGWLMPPLITKGDIAASLS
jgi:molybdenum cofactor cytidylyltransferase